MSIEKLKISRREIILILIIIIIGSIFFAMTFFSHSGKRIRVSRDGQVIEELSLDEDQEREYTFSDETNILVIKDKTADVIEANCQNQICVNTPPIKETGEVIACLPHKLIFEVIE